MAKARKPLKPKPRKPQATQSKQAKRRQGRPTKYRPEYADQAKRACGMGYTDKRLAEMFGVDQRTIDNWKHDYPGFFQSLQDGKDIWDDSVEIALAQRAMGYSHPDVHITSKGARIPVIKHYPPDPTSAIFWLKNRRPKQWRDKHEVDHSGSLTLNDAVIALGIAKGGKADADEGE